MSNLATYVHVNTYRIQNPDIHRARRGGAGFLGETLGAEGFLTEPFGAEDPLGVKNSSTEPLGAKDSLGALKAPENYFPCVFLRAPTLTI